MPRICSISLCLALLTSLCFPAHAAEQPGWLEIHSAHFTVITDAGEKRGREVALRFEQMRAVFSTLLTKERLNQPMPLTILAFKNDQSFYQLAPLQQGKPIAAPAFLLRGDDQEFIALNLTEEESWRAIAHDLAGMLLTYNYPPAQRWFDQGLAEYFATIRVNDRQVEIGGDPSLGKPGTEKSFTELLNTSDWIPLPELFAAKADGANPNPLIAAESWMVMHYLLHQQKLPETGTYFGLVLNQHVSVEDAIQQAYGVSSAKLQESVKEYFHSLTSLQTAMGASKQKTVASPQPYQFPVLVGPDDFAITTKPFPDDDARALYAAVQIRVPERRETGLKTLQMLATTQTAADKKMEVKSVRSEKRAESEDGALLPTTYIGNALAHRVLAADHIYRGEFDEAANEMSAAAALNQRDMWLRYYVSVMKYRLAQSKHTDIQGLPNMMIDLKAVLDWYPEMADAYDLLALARNEGGSTPAAMQAERAAMMLSPRDERYVYHLAQIYIAGKKWDAADALLARLKDSTNPEIAGLARDRLAQVGSERKYGVSAGGTVVAGQSKLTPQKSPFDVLEEDAAKRASAEQTAPTGPDKRTPKFLKGRLVDVDCSQSPSAILTVAVGGAELKLRAADYKSLLLIGADDFSCEWHDRQVTVNYKPGGRTDGDLVSLEVR